MMERDRSKDTRKNAAAGAEARRTRLAAELRANLKRRKAQAKARQTGRKAPSSETKGERDQDGR